MTARSSSLALMIAAIGLTATMSPAASRAAGISCARGRVIAATRAGQLRLTASPGAAWQRTLLACPARNGTPWSIARCRTSPVFCRLAPAAASGCFFAVEQNRGDPGVSDSNSVRLIRADLCRQRAITIIRRGGVNSVFGAGSGYWRRGDPINVSLKAVAINAAGNMAWIWDVQATATLQAPHPKQVWIAVNRRKRQIAESIGITPNSLAITSTRIYWIDKGRPQTTRF
jgi:hypothetical protein